MDPYDLLRIARQLASGELGSGRGRPRQAELRRAVSAAYYAMFHALARCAADMLVGATPSRRSQAAWRQAYRALEHGHARNQCSNANMMSEFPDGIRRFGAVFVDSQMLRYSADYDPDSTYNRFAVLQVIDGIERVMPAFDAVPAIDRRAFAVYALFRTRSA